MLEIPETNILIKIVATLFFGCLLVSWYFCMQFDLCIMQSMQNQNKNNKKTNENVMNCNSFLDQMNGVELWIPSKCSKILVKEQQKLMIPSIIIMTSNYFAWVILTALFIFGFSRSSSFTFDAISPIQTRAVFRQLSFHFERLRQEFCIINAINCGKVFCSGTKCCVVSWLNLVC